MPDLAAVVGLHLVLELLHVTQSLPPHTNTHTHTHTHTPHRQPLPRRPQGTPPSARPLQPGTPRIVRRAAAIRWGPSAWRPPQQHGSGSATLWCNTQPRARAHSDAAAHRALSVQPARPALPRRVLARSRGAGRGSARETLHRSAPTPTPPSQPPEPDRPTRLRAATRSSNTTTETGFAARCECICRPRQGPASKRPNMGQPQGTRGAEKEGRASTRSFGSEGTSAPPPKKLRWPATAARAAGTRAASSERVACLSIVEGSVGLHAKALIFSFLESLFLRQSAFGSSSLRRTGLSGRLIGQG